MQESMMAACGLDCSDCEIRLAPIDPNAAKVIVDWFKSKGWLEENEGIAQVIEKQMYCTGCLGSRETHWSSDCWILKCCVDDHGLQNCSQCETFPCEKLLEWSQKNESYSLAFQRLKTMCQN